MGSLGSSLTFQTWPLWRYSLCCSSRLSGRAPTRPKTPIWLPRLVDGAVAVDALGDRQRVAALRQLEGGDQAGAWAGG